MEIEFKFLVPPERLAEVEAAMRTGGFEAIDLQARYFDTRDGALAKADVALRMRKEGDHWVQTAKARGDGPLDRFEHNVDLGDPADRTALPDIGLHQDTHVGRALEKAIGGAELIETFSTAIRRVVRLEIELDMPDNLVRFVKEGLDAKNAMVTESNGFLGMTEAIRKAIREGVIEYNSPF